MNWIFFPKTDPIPQSLFETIDVFDDVSEEIDSTKNDRDNDLRLKSDEVLKILAPGLIKKGYEVERSKKAEDKVRVPVLFGGQGAEELAFEADAYNKEARIVLEVEAGRAVVNYQFLKDIFQASMMVDTEYLILAVRCLYRGKNDFEAVSKYLDTIYLTKKIKLDLKGVLLIGY